MKKILALLLSAIVLLASCATSVGIEYAEASEIDMGPYRNIAIASTVPFSGFIRPSSYVRTMDSYSYASYGLVFSSYGYNLKDSVASYATNSLVRTLSSSGYFNITGPNVTDRMLASGSIGYDRKETFERNGIDAVIIPRIESMTVNEYIYSTVRERVVVDKDGHSHVARDVDYHYTADQGMVFTFTVVDAKSERIIAKRSYPLSDSYSCDISSPFFAPSDTDSRFYDMIDSVQYDILAALVPRKVMRYESLMENDPKVDGVKTAYKSVEDGNYSAALAVFRYEWDSSRHLPSGYNSALLLAALGRYDEAAAMVGEVLDEYPGNSKVLELQGNIDYIIRSNEVARAQIEGLTEKPKISEGGDVYDALLGI